MIYAQVLLLSLFMSLSTLSSTKTLENTIWKIFKNATLEVPSESESIYNSRKDLIINGITGRITNRDWRRQVTQVKWPINGWLSDVPTNVVRCKLFCRTGYHLQIRRNGVVSGTLNQNSKYTMFELQSFGPSIIRIKNLATNHYLIMKRNGCITGSKKPGTLESLFRETHEFNAFNSYASVKYLHKEPLDMLVAIKHNGKLKRAMKTKRSQSATQFLVINEDKN